MFQGYLAPAATGHGRGVIVIQEWWGLVGHIKNVVDRFAAADFTALAPDFYKGKATAEPDEAGSLMGVVSNKIKGKAEFVNFSFDVKFEGKNVPRALDLMLHNDKNTPPFPVLQPPVIVLPKKDKPVCLLCEKEL